MSRSNDPAERTNILRKAFRIKVKGDDAPPPLEEWADIEARYGCPPRVLENLEALGFARPTPIQRQSAAALLAGRELLAMAPTGSGKTLAFLVPVVGGIARDKVTSHERAHTRAVVLSPTRELGGQTATVARLLAKGTGVHASLASRALGASGKRPAAVDLLVGTPARVAQMVARGECDLGRCQWVVLDEADKLFEMGFLGAIDEVLAACGKDLGAGGAGGGGGGRGGEREGGREGRGARGKGSAAAAAAAPAKVTRALFSATLPERVEEAARSVLAGPLRVTVGSRNASSENVQQRLLFVGREEGKLLALRQILTSGVKPPVLVFVHSKERARALHHELLVEGFKVDSLHGDQPQASRNAAVQNFRTGKTWVLVATDLIGRGMDFLGVNTVVNYDFPSGTMDYVHRVGRTGRAGRGGEAVTFFTEEDGDKLRAVVNVMREAGCEVPAWMLTLKKTRRGHYNAKAGVARRPEAGGDGKGGKGGKGKRGRREEEAIMHGATLRAPRPGAKRRRPDDAAAEPAPASAPAEEAPRKKKPRRAPKKVREAHAAAAAAAKAAAEGA